LTLNSHDLAFNDDHKIMGINFGRNNFYHFLSLLQLIFWSFWLILAYSSIPAQSSSSGPILYALHKILIMMAGVYFNYFVLIPRLLEKNKYLSYILSICLLISFLISLRYVIDIPLLWVDSEALPRLPVPIFVISIVLIGSTLFKFMEAWFSMTQQKVALQNQRLEAELKFLKTQVNPHFLFNTLNNLYSLALLKDDRAPQMIAKLSEIMRYLLSDTRITKVKLVKEMELLRSYIDLHQLKEEKTQNVDVYVEGVKNKHTIASLLLINFLENSFKHGDLDSNPQGWIKVSTIVDETDTLHFSLANSISYQAHPYYPPAHAPESTHGIGLTNAKRQLELHYPDRHQLQITAKPDHFKIELSIDLSQEEISDVTTLDQSIA
ncbi:MAG: sensor histidine kinase, partial [Bacteroidota bacterium]